MPTPGRRRGRLGTRLSLRPLWLFSLPAPLALLAELDAEGALRAGRALTLGCVRAATVLAGLALGNLLLALTRRRPLGFPAGLGSGPALAGLAAFRDPCRRPRARLGRVGAVAGSGRSGSCGRWDGRERRSLGPGRSRLGTPPPTGALWLVPRRGAGAAVPGFGALAPVRATPRTGASAPARPERRDPLNGRRRVRAPA